MSAAAGGCLSASTRTSQCDRTKAVSVEWTIPEPTTGVRAEGRRCTGWSCVRSGVRRLFEQEDWVG